MNKNVAGILTNGDWGVQLSIHMAERGHDVVLYHVETEHMTNDERGAFTAALERCSVESVCDLETFVLSIRQPRIIMLVSKDTFFAESLLDGLVHMLDPEDIIVDTCDTYFKTADIRIKDLEKEGIHYLPTGFSGGSEGALHGASFMPGGRAEVYEIVKPLLADAAAEIEGFSCCPYIGPAGSGQYVKMIHNSIEYALLQVLCEAVHLLQNALNCDSVELTEILSEWNTGELESYMIDIVTDIAGRTDAHTGQPFLSIVLDRVSYGSSLIWMVNSAMELSYPVPILIESLNARFLSNMMNERIASSKLVKPPIAKSFTVLERKMFIERLRRALYLGYVCAYAQAFALLSRASDLYEWNLNIPSIAKTFQGGSYIRSKLLYRVADAYETSRDLDNLFADTYFRRITDTYMSDLREVAAAAIAGGFAAPTILSAVSYIDSYRCARLPYGMIQLVRDYIGISGYERTDIPGVFHADWQNPGNELKSKRL